MSMPPEAKGPVLTVKSPMRSTSLCALATLLSAMDTPAAAVPSIKSRLEVVIIVSCC
jgi:hypothetical protein